MGIRPSQHATLACYVDPIFQARVLVNPGINTLQGLKRLLTRGCSPNPSLACHAARLIASSAGRHLTRLPIAPSIGKLIVTGAALGCLGPALIIGAGLSHRDPFILPSDKRMEANSSKRKFSGNSQSDHLALLAAFEAKHPCFLLSPLARVYSCW